MQQAQLQRQIHALQMHQLQQDYPPATSAGQLYTHSLPAAYAQHNSLPSARPLNVKQEGGGSGGLTIQPPPPTLTPSRLADLTASGSMADSLQGASIASSMLGAFNIGTFAAPAAKGAKAGNAAAKGGLKRTLTLIRLHALAHLAARPTDQASQG